MPTAFLLRRLDTQEFNIENLIFLFKVKVQTFLVLSHSKRLGAEPLVEKLHKCE